MKIISATELKQNLGKYIDEVAEGGETILVKKNSRPAIRIEAINEKASKNSFSEFFGILNLPAGLDAKKEYHEDKYQEFLKGAK